MADGGYLDCDRNPRCSEKISVLAPWDSKLNPILHFEPRNWSENAFKRGVKMRQKCLILLILPSKIGPNFDGGQNFFPMTPGPNFWLKTLQICFLRD